MEKSLKKGEFYNKTNIIKQLLNNISPSICMAKWFQVSLHLPQGKTHSCYHPPAHKIPINEIKLNSSALHNTIEKKEERRKMKEGTRPAGCNFCWNTEDLNFTSDRHYRACEYFDLNWAWAQDKLEEINRNPYDYDPKPSYVEVNFNQACNLKCMYCSPHLSKTWEEEIIENGPYTLYDRTHNDLRYLDMPISTAEKDNPYVNAFWEWLPQIYNDLRVFRMTGGEPLMDKNTFRMLDYVYKNPHPLLELSITSNLCPPDPKLLDKFIEKVNLISSSFDTNFNKVKESNLNLINVKFYVPNEDDSIMPHLRKRYLVEESVQGKNILSNLERISENNINDNFDETGLDKNTGAFIYSEYFHKLGNEYISSNYSTKNVMVYISLDSVGNQAEYIRHGLHYETLTKNIDQLLTNTHNVTISFINTFNILSLPNLKGFLEYILYLRKTYNEEFQKNNIVKFDHLRHHNFVPKQLIWFDTPYLEYPDWFSIQIIKDYPELIKFIEDAIVFMEQNVSISQNSEIKSEHVPGFKLYEVNRMKRNLEWCKLGTNDVDTKMKNFYTYFKEYDKRKNLSFVKIFPDLENFYNTCKLKYLEDKREK